MIINHYTLTIIQYSMKRLSQPHDAHQSLHSNNNTTPYVKVTLTTWWSSITTLSQQKKKHITVCTHAILKICPPSISIWAAMVWLSVHVLVVKNQHSYCMINKWFCDGSHRKLTIIFTWHIALSLCLINETSKAFVDISRMFPSSSCSSLHVCQTWSSKQQCRLVMCQAVDRRCVLWLFLWQW